MKHLISAALSLAISCPVHAASLAADVLLEAAVGYTVKIKRTSGIGLNEDRGSSTHATGFLVDKQRGWILTNAHVATRSPTTLSISFKGQSYVNAKRIFVDRLTDVAVLEIATTAIPATTREAALQCGEQPRIGTAVAIFGHPGELSYTATRGIISSIPWVFPTEVIQSDAVVNGGNSGGPIISLETGKVVGIAAATNLATFAKVRRQELEGFVEGMFNGQDRADLPARAHQALGQLGELRAMMAGIEDLVARDIKAESRSQLETTFKHVQELTRIMEVEIHKAVMSCARARRQMQTDDSLPRSAFH